MKYPQVIFPLRNTLTRYCLRNYATTKRTTQNLINYPKVKLGEGKLLYLLISIYMHGETLFSRTIVRGGRAKKHLYLYDEIREELDELGLCSKALGGGMMNINAKSQEMTINGKCKTFGRADHHLTKEILLGTPEYKNFKITVGK
ncbi:PREDICTED: sex-regulated protein janus-B-like [Drosophila arizonae]|uniref:Sex-regulated protein janus-B-like n=1 Tax=Drosophila arizonae TaxID=7263 RepID=A0ABM1NTJ6_DROAR|nr:PREDICTED: sex-regulated protein janus-B-like [Drosophila arizonae]